MTISSLPIFYCDSILISIDQSITVDGYTILIKHIIDKNNKIIKIKNNTPIIILLDNINTDN